MARDRAREILWKPTGRPGRALRRFPAPRRAGRASDAGRAADSEGAQIPWPHRAVVSSRGPLGRKEVAAGEERRSDGQGARPDLGWDGSGMPGARGSGGSGSVPRQGRSFRPTMFECRAVGCPLRLMRKAGKRARAVAVKYVGLCFTVTDARFKGCSDHARRQPHWELQEPRSLTHRLRQCCTR